MKASGRCASCGCSPSQRCPDGCVWMGPDLCSRCALHQMADGVTGLRFLDQVPPDGQVWKVRASRSGGGWMLARSLVPVSLLSPELRAAVASCRGVPVVVDVGVDVAVFAAHPIRVPKGERHAN